MDKVGFYSADTFNEQSPPTNDPDYLRGASRGVFEVNGSADASSLVSELAV